MQNSTQTKPKNTNERQILLKYEPFAHYTRHTPHTHTKCVAIHCNWDKSSREGKRKKS